MADKMKTAIYIEDGIVQLVITPETDFEKNSLSSFSEDGEVDAKIFEGSFYDCRGGWVRQKNHYPINIYNGDTNNEKSLILTQRKNHDR